MCVQCGVTIDMPAVFELVRCGRNDLRIALLRLDNGEVTMTSTGFIDDSGTEYVGKRLTNAEHGQRTLRLSNRWIDLKDGTVFEITDIVAE